MKRECRENSFDRTFSNMKQGKCSFVHSSEENVF